MHAGPRLPSFLPTYLCFLLYVPMANQSKLGRRLTIPQLVLIWNAVLAYSKKGRNAVTKLLGTNKLVTVLALFTIALSVRQLRIRPTSRSAVLDDRPLASVRPDGSRELWVPYRGKLRCVVIRPTKKSTFDIHATLFNPNDVSRSPSKATSQFFNEFKAIASIILPRVSTKVTGFLAIQMILLSFRTYLSLVVARLDGHIIRSMISANGSEFLQGLGKWLLLGIPAAYTNALIRFLEEKISLEFRTKLVRYIHDLYVAPGLEYYRLNNIDGQIQGADNYITTDVTRFCDAAASLYSSIGKPTIDIFFFCYQLSRNLGRTAFIGMFINYGLTAMLLKSVAPPFGKLAAIESAYEGDYRNAHQRIITNAEEIAFYDGASIERKSLVASFRKIYDHSMRLLRVRAWYWIVEDMVLKYSWSASGFLFASIPVFLPSWASGAGHETVADKSLRERARMGDFVTNKRLMLSLSDAGGRLMYSIKDLAELAGYTQRVYTLIAALQRVRLNSYAQLLKGEEVPANYSLADVEGTIQQGYPGFRLEGTPVVVPGLGFDLSPGEPLLDPIDMRIGPGEHLLITGPNGVGKTSIARMAAGLWPVFRGLLSEPSKDEIVFLPQRPYFSVGSLRDQVIYPDTYSEMLQKGVTDQDLQNILLKVKLDYIPDREGGWNTVKEWKDVFSGGEKQRMLFARILYAKPKFAVIDEGTSAVSQDVEGLLYEVCKKAGVTLITISHRIALLKYHTCMLQVGLGDDASKWHFQRTDKNADQTSVRDEITHLRETLAQVPEMQKRRDEIAKELGLPQADSGLDELKKKSWTL